MNKLLILTILVLAHLHLSAQTDNYKKGNSILEKEIKLLIDSAKNNSYGHGVYNIYTVQLYNTGPDRNSLAFCVSYIQNEVEYAYPTIKPRVLKIDTNIVLIIAPPGYSSIWLNTYNFEVLDNANRALIKKRLPPNNNFILRENEAEELFVLYSNDVVQQHFFTDDPGDRMRQNCFANASSYPELKEAFKCDSVVKEKERINIKPVQIPKY